MFKLTLKTSKRRPRRRSGVFIVNFEHISHLFNYYIFLITKKLLSNKIIY